MAWLIALAMMAGIELRQGGPAITPAQAQAMSPDALADALLAPGHPPVTEAVVREEGMYPPPPPNVPITTAIKLFLPARISSQRGFCEKQVLTVTLAPAENLNGNPSPARPATLTSALTYRLPGNDPRHPSKCEAPRSSFFSLSQEQPDLPFAAVRLLATAKLAAMRRGSMPFEVTVHDIEGGQTQEKIRRDPTWARGLRPDLLSPFTDGRAALAALPIGTVWYAGPADGIDDIVPPADLAVTQGQRLSALKFYMGGDWSAGVVTINGKITRVRLRREVPLPF